MAEELAVGEELSIPLSEITLRASRSSGPGGQHANVTASRIEASFDVLSSQILSDAQRERLLARAGPLVVAIAQDARSQGRNRELALARLAKRLEQALAVPRNRRATRPTAASRERRLAAKRRGTERKRERRPPARRLLVQELLDVALVQPAQSRLFRMKADRTPERARGRRPGDDQVDAQHERRAPQLARADSAAKGRTHSTYHGSTQLSAPAGRRSPSRMP